MKQVWEEQHDWEVGDVVETRAGLWEISFIGPTVYVLRNNNGRLHIMYAHEMDLYCTRVEL